MVVVVVTRCVQVTGLALSGDCTLLASCSWDGTVAVWSLGARPGIIILTVTSDVPGSSCGLR